MSSISDPLEEVIVLNSLSVQIESKSEDERVLEVDRDIDAYKQQIDTTSHMRTLFRLNLIK